MNRKRVPGRQGISKPLSAESVGALMSVPEPQMLVKGVIPKGAIIMIEGPSHTGKTFFAFELARAIATRTPFMGHYPTEHQGNTLVVEQDSPKADAGKVAWAMVRDQWEDREYLGFRDDQPLEGVRFLWHQDLDLWNGNDVASIIRAANEVEVHAAISGPKELVPVYDEHGDITGYEHINSGVALVILDSFRSLHTAEENESGEMELVMQEMKYIRAQTNATVLFVHHANARAERPRGSTAIEAAADMIFSLRRKKNSTLVTVEVTKGRIVQPNGFVYQIVTEEHETGNRKYVRFVSEKPQYEPEEETTKPADTGMQELQQNIIANPGITRSESLAWAEAKNYSARSHDSWIRELKEVGLIRADRDKDGARYTASGSKEKA